MLRRLIDTSYRFAKIDQNQVLKAFVETRNRINNHIYGSQANQKRIDFFNGEYYSQRKNRNDVENHNTDQNEKEKKGWNIASFYLIAASIMAYLLINSQASADQEEDVKELETNGVGSNVHLKILSKKLAANLPSLIENYVDFRGKKELLDQKLNEREIVVISGAGGMGKSTLAAQYGNDCQQGGNTQVIWIKGTQIEEEFSHFAGILGIETNDLSSEIIRNLVYGNLQDLFDKNQILLIFDNVETKEKIEKYLINLPSTAKVIITARNRNLLEGIRPVNVDGFSKDEASFYLRQAIKSSEEETETIINVVGESPFRLSIVVAYLKNHRLMSVDEFVDIYLTIKGVKSERSQNEEIYPEVEMLFGNLKNDSPKAWQLLKYLAYLDAEGVSVKFIREIMDQTLDELEATVNDLRKLSLVKIKESNETTLKVSHRIIQDETKKALVEEDQTQVPKLLKKLIGELDQVFPNVNDNPEHWRKAIEWINHAEQLTQEGKKVNLAFTDLKSLFSKIGNYSYYIKFNYKEAINYWNELLDYQRKIYPSDHPEIAVLLNSVGTSYTKLGGKEDLRKGLQYKKDALTMYQTLFPGDHPYTANSLNNVGWTYAKLEEEENLRKGLQYLKKGLKMREALFSGDHSATADSLNNIGYTYGKLSGEENLRKSLHYLEKGLKMRQALFLGNYLGTARSLNNIGSTYIQLGWEENLHKGLKYLEDALEMLQVLFPGNHPDTAFSFKNIGSTYAKLEGEENLCKGLKYLNNGLNMQQALFPGNHPATANALSRIGCTYTKLAGQENLRKGLKYQEDALKMQQTLFPGNNPWTSLLLHNLVITYQKLGDENKALEYMKQAYSIYAAKFDENHKKVRDIKVQIESLEPNFFINQQDESTLKCPNCLGGNKVGPECRWIINSRGKVDDGLLELKKKIQSNVLNTVVESVESYKWSHIGWLSYDLGVKGYVEKSYLKKQLGELGNREDNIEVAQMLTFEAMNLGIMKSANKPYDVVEGFTQDNPELVKKIAVEHPEFFVDGSIVEACIKAMPNDKFFEEHMLKHVKYMGMEVRKAQRQNLSLI